MRPREQLHQVEPSLQYAGSADYAVMLSVGISSVAARTYGRGSSCRCIRWIRRACRACAWRCSPQATSTPTALLCRRCQARTLRGRCRLTATLLPQKRPSRCDSLPTAWCMLIEALRHPCHASAVNDAQCIVPCCPSPSIKAISCCNAKGICKPSDAKGGIECRAVAVPLVHRLRGLLLTPHLTA